MHTNTWACVDGHTCSTVFLCKEVLAALESLLQGLRRSPTRVVCTCMLCRRSRRRTNTSIPRSLATTAGSSSVSWLVCCAVNLKFGLFSTSSHGLGRKNHRFSKSVPRTFFRQFSFGPGFRKLAFGPGFPTFILILLPV